jgi:hypothetical protein
MDAQDIRNRLKKANRTQGELAAFLGIHWTTLSRQLRGVNRLPRATLLSIEAFFEQHEKPRSGPGVRETATAYVQSNNDKPRLTEEEKQRIIQEIMELSDALSRLPRITDMTDDEILGYDENGIPEQPR